MSPTTAPLASRLRRAQPQAVAPTPAAPSPAAPPAWRRCPRSIIERADLPWPDAPRIQIRRRKGCRLIAPGAVVILGEWGSPFRIHQAPAGCKPYQVQWWSVGLGKGRPCPDWWAPINCPGRRIAQLEILAALELWL